MRALDLPLARLRGRTPRELLLLAIGGGYCLYELAIEPTCWPNLAMYALATAAFAWRFFPARALGVGTAIGALAQRLPDLRFDTTQLVTPHTWIALATIAVLVSKDLEARFDRAPSRVAWLPNAWAELPVADMRRLRGCVYALGALGAGLGVAWGVPFASYAVVDPTLSFGALSAITLIIVLLAAGRAPALLLVPIVCVPLALVLGAELADAETRIASGWAPFYDFLGARPQFVLPSFVLAIVATALALPYCARLLRTRA